MMTARSMLVSALFVVLAAMSGPAFAQSVTNGVSFPTGITYDGTYLYLTNDAGFRDLYRIDPATGSIVGPTIPLGGFPRDIVYDGSGHFYVSDISGWLKEIDMAGTPLLNVHLPFRGGAIAFDGTNVYVGDTDGSTVLVTDRSGNAIRMFDSGLRPEGMVFDPLTGNLRVITLYDSNIYEITTTGQFVRSCGSPYVPGPFGLGGITVAGARFVIAEPRVPADPSQGTTILFLDRSTLVCTPPACADSTPRIQNVSASTSTLWPPDRRMTAVTVDYTVVDDCDTAGSSLSVTSNEAITEGVDWQVLDAHHVRLRADRLGSGNGRNYVVTIAATDPGNHSSTATVIVRVPHDQGQ